MEEITTDAVQAAVLKWSESGRLDKKGGLGVKSIKDMVILLKMCIRDYEVRYDAEIKLRDIEYPVQGRINRQCALKWEDIDMENRLIKINKTLQRIYLKTNRKKGRTKVIITAPKSVKGIRDIPISDALYGLLNKARCIDKGAYLLTGTRKFIEPRLYGKHYKKFLSTFQFKGIKFHGLRHTFATRCIEAGADYKVVSELLGHSSVNLTLNLYVHPHMDDKRRCVELI